MKFYKHLPDADMSKVIIKKGYPHCKEHGSMLKLTKDGIWRCMTTYLSDKNGGLLRQNNCDVGIQECSFVEWIKWKIRGN